VQCVVERAQRRSCSTQTRSDVEDNDPARVALRQLGQVSLGAWIRTARGLDLWSIQDEILDELSVPRSKLAVPSTNASGKTFLAANACVAFYDAFTPGTPCIQCDPDGTKGGCRGSKVLNTSSKETHLKDNLWGEIRMCIAALARRGILIRGTLAPADTMLVDSWGDHAMRGQVATKEEGFQGYHAAHKLIVGDEATSVSREVARGITSLMATADTRLLLIFNPTTNDTYAAQMSRAANVKTIKITAFHTPHFTGEHIPEGSNLTTPNFLEDLIDQGMGPGSYEWETRILANFWDKGDDSLITETWVQEAHNRDPLLLGTVGLGIDLAAYGTDESTIGVRRGDNLVNLVAHPAGRIDHFINGDPDDPNTLSPVRRAVKDYRPWVIVFDADGPGAGAMGEFTRLHEWAIRNRYMEQGSVIIPFRGGKRVSDHFLNARSAWWWALRKRYERGRIAMQVIDPKLDHQLAQLTYEITSAGQIKVETKKSMKDRGETSPDRGDAVMYTFAFSEELPNPNSPAGADYVSAEGYAVDRSERAMWEKDLDPRRNKPRQSNPITGIDDEL